MRSLDQLYFEAEIDRWLFEQFGWTQHGEEFVW